MDNSLRDALPAGMMIYCMPWIDARMYVIKGDNEAIIVDPHPEGVAALPKAIQRITVLLTHEHFDHTGGVNALKGKYNTSVICSKICAKRIEDGMFTVSFPFLFLKNSKAYTEVRNHYRFPYRCKADKTFTAEKRLFLCGHNFLLKETPGHSPGSMSILMDNRYLFSGDNLMQNENALKSIDSDKEKFMHIALPFYRSLSADTIVFPGHGEPEKLAVLLLHADKLASL